jgi:uncharacterized membrane protein
MSAFRQGRVPNRRGGSGRSSLIGLVSALAILTCVGAQLAGDPTAGAQGTTTTTTTTTVKSAAVSTAATLAFATTSPVLVQTASDTWRTNVVVTLSATCPSAISFWLVLPSAKRVPALDVSDPDPPCGTSNWQVLPETITFGELPGTPAAATLVVSQYSQTTSPTPSGGVATTQLSLQRLLPTVWGVPFGWVILAAVVNACVFLLVIPLRRRQQRKQPSRAGQNAAEGRTDRASTTEPVPEVELLSSPIYAAASWTFKDSWATNITAAGAIVGTFLSASGSVTSLFPGVPLYRFTLANAACGALVVIVPLLVAVASFKVQNEKTPPTGQAIVASFGAVVLGGAFTMFAVGAEFALFGVLIDVSGATGGWTIVFLVILSLGALIILVYALTTTSRLASSSDAMGETRTTRADAVATQDIIMSSSLARSADTSLTL